MNRVVADKLLKYLKPLVGKEKAGIVLVLLLIVYNSVITYKCERQKRQCVSIGDKKLNRPCMILMSQCFLSASELYETIARDEYCGRGKAAGSVESETDPAEGIQPIALPQKQAERQED